MLTLVEDRQKSYPAGWCTYTYEHTQAPELEVICSGINAKTPRASGIWRQGNLLHFGFEQSPAELNENGRALLVNSIAYIARFTEDRPIVHTPSVFYSNVRYMDREAIDRLVKNKDRDLKEYLDWYLGPGAREQVLDADREKLAGWYAGVRGFLRGDERGKLVIDEEARKLGAANDSFDFLQTAIAALAEPGERAELARILLTRYVPDGPAVTAAADEWKSWLHANREYLFFSDTGGFRWYVDPLAKARAVPTAKLRGPLRGTAK